MRVPVVPCWTATDRCCLYFFCLVVALRLILTLLETDDALWTKRANYSVTGAGGNPRSFSVVTHSSWCPVEFGQVPICGPKGYISHNLLLLLL